MADKRRCEDRAPLSIPMRVMGYQLDGSSWEEIATTFDLSKRGAGCVLKQKVQKGHVVLITCAMPKGFRAHDLGEASYRVYAVVRSATADPRGGGYRVGLLFLGKNPPRDYEKQPAGLYLMPGDEPPERREHPRYTVFLTLRLTRMNGEGAPERELTVAEDLGLGGARVPTSLPIAKGEVLLVEEVGGDFTAQAEVRNVYAGPNNVTRLNLKFLDGQVPARLLS